MLQDLLVRGLGGGGEPQRQQQQRQRRARHGRGRFRTGRTGRSSRASPLNAAAARGRGAAVRPRGGSGAAARPGPALREGRGGEGGGGGGREEGAAPGTASNPRAACPALRRTSSRALFQPRAGASLRPQSFSSPPEPFIPPLPATSPVSRVPDVLRGSRLIPAPWLLPGLPHRRSQKHLCPPVLHLLTRLLRAPSSQGRAC